MYRDLLRHIPLYETHLLTCLCVCLLTMLSAFVIGFFFGRRAYRLRYLSTTDTLTGLFNKRYITGRFAQEILRATRYETPLSLFIIDIDWLKSINKSHGYDVGDKVLKAVAAVLENNLRVTDLIGRYTADEFLVLLPHTTAQQSMNAARRIVWRLRQMQADHTLGYLAQPLSVSIGVADLASVRELTTEALLNAAQEALLSAKSTGRGHVRMAASFVPEIFQELRA